MKVAYVFSTSGHTASYKLGKMILPQLEDTTGYPNGHGAEVVGMFFFDDNNFVLSQGDPLGEWPPVLGGRLIGAPGAG
jgi:hypothetical protein